MLNGSNGTRTLNNRGSNVGGPHQFSFLDGWTEDEWERLLCRHTVKSDMGYSLPNRLVLEWLADSSKSFLKLTNYRRIKASVWRYQISSESKLGPTISDDIILIQQYYLDDNLARRGENKLCLLTNTQNTAITKILLLNERLYSDEEIGVKSDKIEQVVIGNRLTYKNVFDYVSDNNIKGYIVLSNTDIFFDKTLSNVMNTNISKKRQVFCQLRFEYESGVELDKCHIYGPSPNSQDTWIWHTNTKVTKKQRKVLDIKLGIPGCDNKMVYLFNILGFSCHNEPYLIKTYHCHESGVRNHAENNERVDAPYYNLFPALEEKFKRNEYPAGIAKSNVPFDMGGENKKMYQYISRNLLCGTHFIIPRIAGIENEVAMKGIISLRDGKDTEALRNNLFVDLQNSTAVMKRNAGIKISGFQSALKYSKMYMSAFHKCNRYFWWEPWGNVGASIPHSSDFITTNFKKPRFDALALDIFDNIAREPWTLALKGKRVLIISPFAESFKEKVDKRTEIYGIDLFPECELLFIQPPQTQGNNSSDEFDVELLRFVEKLENIKDTFDVALCSCGGYGNLVCSALFDMGKSAIYVGGVLQMYFGVYGERWLKERPDIMELYMNEHWSRPKEVEKPSGFESVEDSCYW